jgi:ArsR family transcriptional regulator
MQAKRPPSTPLQASRRPAALDRRLDPAIFKPLADPTRCRILACLVKCGRPCSVTEVAACCDLDFSTVARHLNALARGGWLGATKDGRWVRYDADAAALAARFRELADAVEDAAGTRCCGEGCR